MRTYGVLNPTVPAESPPSIVQTLLIAGSSGQAMNWGGSTVGSSDAGAQVVRFTGMSTTGALLNFMVNLETTACAAPSSGLTTASTDCDIPVLGSRFLAIPNGSTGFSVAALSSGYIIAEVWRR